MFCFERFPRYFGHDYDVCHVSSVVDVDVAVVRQLFKKSNFWWKSAVVVVKWSASSPSTQTIWVRILLKPTIYSVKLVFEKKQKYIKRWQGWSIKKLLRDILFNYFCIFIKAASNYLQILFLFNLEVFLLCFVYIGTR